MAHVHNRLAEMRQAAGLSQIALARELGVNTSTVSRWESGERAMPDGVKLRLATRFGVSVSHLMGWPEPETAA